MNMLPQRWMKKDIGAEVCRHFLDHGNAVIAMAHNRTNNLVGWLVIRCEILIKVAVEGLKRVEEMIREQL